MFTLTTINCSFTVSQKTPSAISCIQQCVSVIEQWMAASRLRLNTDKTELMWTGTKDSVSEIPLSLTLGDAHVVAADNSLPNCMSQLSLFKCFFQLRQIRRIWRFLNDDSAATLVHAFVDRQPDWLPWQSPDRYSEEDWEAAACPQRCGPNRCQLPQVRSRAASQLGTYGDRAFAYIGPAIWNSLPNNLKNTYLSLPTFERHLKTFFLFLSAHRTRLRCFTETRYICSLLLLTMSLSCTVTEI